MSWRWSISIWIILFWPFEHFLIIYDLLYDHPRGSHLQGTLKNNLNQNILNTNQPVMKLILWPKRLSKMSSWLGWISWIFDFCHLCSKISKVIVRLNSGISLWTLNIPRFTLNIILVIFHSSSTGHPRKIMQTIFRLNFRKSKIYRKTPRIHPNYNFHDFSLKGSFCRNSA